MLLIAAVLLGLAPFYPEPHLLQKANMLLNGEALRPLDMFDIFWHAWPMLWLVLRLFAPSTASCSIKQGKGG